jgi:hypothetical protein
MVTKWARMAANAMPVTSTIQSRGSTRRAGPRRRGHLAESEPPAARLRRRLRAARQVRAHPTSSPLPLDMGNLA